MSGGRLILALNGGSSSVKYALFRGEDELARGAANHLSDDRSATLEAIAQRLSAAGHPSPEAIGHRIVHGGPRRRVPALFDRQLRADLDAAVPFAPLHLPGELQLIDAAAARYQAVPQFVCFDTGFHRDMPEVAQRFALPEPLYAQGIRRYGFHGLSYQYVVAQLGAEKLGRAVIAHLGSGSSLVAVHGGRSLDTTMAFTPTAGLVMSTRTGDLDPGVLLYLLQQGYDAKTLERLINHESGLLALSQRTGDIKELVERAPRDARAALAIEIFCRSIVKGVGALVAVLGGLDSLVFTGGVGAHSKEIRDRVVSQLGYLGRGYIVHALETDEERVIARAGQQLLGDG